MVKSPVLFLIFNRPDNTLKVFETIRAAQPATLYIASDGPRDHIENEKQIVYDLRRSVLEKVDWKCTIRTLFRDTNLGCKEAVSKAINWFFENEEEGIILEDDCLPHEDFFIYCDGLLNKYRDCEKVMCIGGDGSYVDKTEIGQKENSYSFSRYPLIWGWASWRRAWQKYNVAIKEEYLSIGRELLKKRLIHKNSIEYWHDVFYRVAAGAIDTWDFQWTWAMLRENGVCCVPNGNLITNIGFGKCSTHTGDKKHPRANVPFKKIKLPFQHPESVDADLPVNALIEKKVFRIEHAYTFKGYIKVLLKRIRKLSIKMK